jgi:regulator of replication initiation timing
MKTKLHHTGKLILLLLMFATPVVSQSIINTVGTDGIFAIKDATNNFLTLSQTTGLVNILRTFRLENTFNSTTGIMFKGADRFLHNYGTNNMFMGISSGNFTMTGTDNTVIGMNTLRSNTTGYQNTAMGLNALGDNVSGSYMTAFGYKSLSSNYNGFYNTALGYQTLFTNYSGSYNTAVGSWSLYNNTNGHSNTALGMNTLSQNTTGIQNTAIGYSSLYANFNGNNNTAMGFESLRFTTTTSQNTAVGYRSLYNNQGNYNTALGHNAGSTITTGANLTCIGIDAAPSTATAIDQVTLGNGFVQSLRCNVQTISSLSDARDKKNITDLTLGLDFLMKVKPRQFNWDKREWYEGNKSDGSKMKETFTAGFISQELDEAQTTENADWLNLVLKDNPEKLEATYGNLLPVMVKAIQELKEENDELKVENGKLKIESVEQKNESKEMEQRLLKLEQKQNTLVSELEKIKSKGLNVMIVKSGEEK